MSCLKILKKLTAAFQFDTDFTSATEGLDYLSSKALEFMEYYGDAFDDEGMQELINESILANQEILATLDPQTEAYKDMQESIWQAEAALAVMRGEVATATEYYEQHGIVIAGVTDRIEENSAATDENAEKAKTWSEVWTDAINAVNGDYNQWTKDANSVNTLLDQLEYFNIDLIGSDQEEQINAFMVQLNQQLSELDPNSQAWEDLKEIIDSLTLRIYDMTYGTDQLTTSVNNSAQDLKATIDAINLQITSFENAIADLQSQKVDVEVKIEAKQKEIDDLNAYIQTRVNDLEAIRIQFQVDLADLLSEYQAAQAEVTRIAQEPRGRKRTALS